VSVDPSFVPARETNLCRFEEKLTKREYEQLVRAITAQQRPSVAEVRSTDISVLLLIIDRV